MKEHSVHGSLVRGAECDLYNNCNSVEDEDVPAGADSPRRGHFDNEAAAISELVANSVKENLHIPSQLYQPNPYFCDPRSFLKAEVTLRSYLRLYGRL
jgi:hypothetical protein